ncbi:hypothetical protein HN51_022102 [Arachis hypogaea]
MRKRVSHIGWGELELPFLALLLVILSPYEVMRFSYCLFFIKRFNVIVSVLDTKEGAIVSLLIAVINLKKSLNQGSIVVTIAVVCITIASLLLLI